MKQVTKYRWLAAAGVMLCIGLVVWGVGQLATAFQTGGTESSGPGKTQELQAFDDLVVSGMLDLVVEPGNPAIEFPGDGQPGRFKFTQSGQTLRIESGPAFPGKGGVVRVRTRQLHRLQIEGAGSCILKGLEADKLAITADGAMNLRLENSRIGQLGLDLEGAIQLEGRQSVARDVTVKLDGMVRVGIALDGGTLGGQIKGMSSLEYAGQPGKLEVAVRDGTSSLVADTVTVLPFRYDSKSVPDREE